MRDPDGYLVEVGQYTQLGFHADSPATAAIPQAAIDRFASFNA
jgi:hypothetical protein